MSDPEKENYSIDEMMERLKSRSGSTSENEPELVTREDGTQVYRVRKRKRRSRQPHKEKEIKSRRLSLVMISLATVLAFVAGLGVLAWVLYLNGRGYQGKVQDRIAEYTSADVEMRSFRATPLGVGAEAVDFKWPESSVIKSLFARQISGDLDFSSHLSGKWSGSLIRAGAVDVVLDKAVGTELGSGGSEGSLPFRFPMRAGRLSVRMGGQDNSAVAYSEGLGTLTITDPDRPQATLVVEGGKLRIWNWGRYDMGVGSFTVAEDGVHLGTIVFSPSEMPKSEIRLQSIDDKPLPIRGGEYQMNMSLTNLPSEQVLGAGLGSLLEATFDSLGDSDPCVVTADLTNVQSVRVKGALTSTPSSMLYLRKLQMFTALAALMDNPIFHEPRLELKEPISFTRDSENGVAIQDFDFDGRGMLRIRGRMSVDPDGNLSGTLEVGIHETWAQLCNSRALPMVFSQVGAGYRWGTVNLSGTAKAPVDDLEQQLRAAVEQTPPSTTGEAGLDDEFESLTNPDR